MEARARLGATTAAVVEDMLGKKIEVSSIALSSSSRLHQTKCGGGVVSPFSFFSFPSRCPSLLDDTIHDLHDLWALSLCPSVSKRHQTDFPPPRPATASLTIQPATTAHHLWHRNPSSHTTIALHALLIFFVRCILADSPSALAINNTAVHQHISSNITPLLSLVRGCRFAARNPNHVYDTESEELHPPREAGTRRSIAAGPGDNTCLQRPCSATAIRPWWTQCPATTCKLRDKRAKRQRAQASTGQRATRRLLCCCHR